MEPRQTYLDVVRNLRPEDAPNEEAYERLALYLHSGIDNVIMSMQNMIAAFDRHKTCSQYPYCTITEFGVELTENVHQAGPNAAVATILALMLLVFEHGYDADTIRNETHTILPRPPAFDADAN